MSKTAFKQAPEVVSDALRRVFSNAVIEIYGPSSFKPSTRAYQVYIAPGDESGFSVTLLSGEQSFSLDGLDDQNARAAVAIRDMLGDVGPVIAVDEDGLTYIDLVPGMDPDHFYEGWQPMDNIDRDVWS